MEDLRHFQLPFYCCGCRANRLGRAKEIMNFLNGLYNYIYHMKVLFEELFGGTVNFEGVFNWMQMIKVAIITFVCSIHGR